MPAMPTLTPTAGVPATVATLPSLTPTASGLPTTTGLPPLSSYSPSQTNLTGLSTGQIYHKHVLSLTLFKHHLFKRLQQSLFLQFQVFRHLPQFPKVKTLKTLTSFLN